MCGIDKQVFDRASAEPDGFEVHIKSDHNMWSYLYFIFMLWEQDKDDDDGLEQYVRRAIEASDISWFPLNKAIRLDHADTEEELTLREIETEIQAFERVLETKIANMESDMSGVMELLSQTVRMHHRKGSVKESIAQVVRESLYNAAAADDLLDGMSDTATATTNEGSAKRDSFLLEPRKSATEGEPPAFEDPDQCASDINDWEESDGLQAHWEGGESDEDLSDSDEGDKVVQTQRGQDAEQLKRKLEAADFPGFSDAFEANAVVGGASVLVKERSAAYWDMEGVSIPGTADHSDHSGARCSGLGPSHYHRANSIKQEFSVEEKEEEEKEESGAASVDVSSVAPIDR
jgi:hypothetical protein